MNLTEKSAYIKGLADGLELDKTTKEGKILAALLELVDEMAQQIADIQVDIEEIDEVLNKRIHKLFVINTGNDGRDMYRNCWFLPTTKFTSDF